MNSNGITRLTRDPQPIPSICPRCGGVGRTEAATDRGTYEAVCPVCGGAGRVDARTAAEHRQPDRQLYDHRHPSHEPA